MIDLIGLVRHFWKSFLLFTIGGVLLGGFYAFTKPILYRSSAVLLPVIDSTDTSSLAGGLGALAGLSGSSFGGSNEKEASIAFLESRRLFQILNEKHNLVAQFADQESSSATTTDETGKTTSIEDVAYRRFDRGVRQVQFDRRSGLVTVSITWLDAKKAQLWAEDMTSLANKFLSDQAKDESARAMDYLNKQVAATSIVELQKSIYNLMESELKKSLLANVRKDFAFKVIDPPVVSSRKNKVAPKRALILIGSVLAAICLFFVYAAVFRAAPNTKP